MNGSARPVRFLAFRRQLALATSAVMLGTLLQAVNAPTATAVDTPPDVAALMEKPVRGGATGKPRPRQQTPGPRTPAAEPQAAWPKPGSSVVTLPALSAGRTPDLHEAAGLPVKLSAPSDAAGGHPGARAKATKEAVQGPVRARVLDREATERADVEGVLLSLEAARSEAKSAAGPISGVTSVHLDYSSFGQAYGGGWASRLTLVELPACALTTPTRDECRTSKPVPTENDTEQQTLSADAVTLRASGPTVLAAVADDEGESGDYKATPLSPSATWGTDLSTGDLNWAYEMPVPEVPGGFAPNVGLSYSSGQVDGRTGGTNNQSSWIGDGFDLWPGYIERRYQPCAEDGVKNGDGNKPGDLCWDHDNAFITFNGKGGELVPVADDEWKLKKDDGTRIKRLASTARANGDNDGEYWRLTDPEGTRYYFGYNRLPGWSSGSETTDSTWTTPVFGNNAGEPCHAAAFKDSWCQQAWRWNLDYAVDLHGNAVAYYYNQEKNSYGRNLTAKDNTSYVRGGHLDRIEYGLKSNAVYSGKALAKVEFTNAERCLPNSKTTCASIESDAFYWYDTPWDLNCKASEDCDRGRLSPTFWTRKRLTGVTTHLLNGTDYSKVDSWKLGHRWGQADVDYQLLLDSVQQTGHTATPEITLPRTTFAYKQMANRLDRTGDGYAPFIKARLSGVDDESGGQVTVDYSAPACNWNSLPTPQTNTTRCFPQYIGGSSSDDPERHWFNKYVATSVTTTDRTGGAADSVVAYDYKGGAAWHFDDDGLTKEKFKTWSQWRGYGHVTVRTGGAGGGSALKSQSDSYFLRGMHGDKKAPSGGTKEVSVALGEGEGEPITDHDAASGFEYKTVTFDKPAGKVLAKTVNRPWRHETAKKVRSWGTIAAHFTGTSHTKSWTSLDDGAGANWRVTSASNTHDTVAGRLTQVDDFGDNSVASDNTCMRTTYATNTSANLLGLESRVETVAVGCGTNPDRSKDVIEDIRTAYDGGAYGAAPTKGDETAVAVLKEHDGGKATYLESGTTYDTYGRPLTTTDITAQVTVTGTGAPVRTVRNDGRTATTVYSPASGLPTRITETTPPAKAGVASSAQTTTTDLNLLRSQPKTITDPNNKVTTFQHDALGRSSKIWRPDRRTTTTPSLQFTYFVTEGKPVAVRTQTPTNGGNGQIASYSIYDGLLRERQTQTPGPDGGRLLTDVFYDERGLTERTNAAYFTGGAPSSDLFRPDNALSVDTQTRHYYDGLGRETENRLVAGNGDGGEPQVKAVTRTLYGGDRTTVLPPEGGTATTTLVDARGLSTELRQHHHRAANAPFDSTKYQHTPKGQLAKVTDPAGNVWTYTYDQLGRQVRTSDPDKGVSRTTYDDRGQAVSATDSRDVTLFSVYDDLGRKTELREGSATGTLRAKWTFDTIGGAKGHLTESARYVGGQAYINRVTAYDSLYRPYRQAVVIPASEGALAGTYQTGTAFWDSGVTRSVSYSAAGSLPGSAYTYTYEDETLRPTAVTGEGFGSSTVYSRIGQPLQHALGRANSPKNVFATYTYEAGTKRLATSRVDRLNIAGVDRHSTYRYDAAGNVTAIADVSRSGTDTQCYAYDHLRRLTEAWAQGTSTCAPTPTSDKVGGVAPYWHSYTYDKAGNRLTETQHDPGGSASKDIKRAYAYPAPGQPQAHTLTSVTQTAPSSTSQDSFTYDAAGNTATRLVGGDTQRFTWDAEGRLVRVAEAVEGSADKVSEYLYDADGNRLIARTSTETTLYLGHTDVVLPKGASKAKATRYIPLGGGHQAVQADDNSVTFTMADHHGTGQLAIEAGNLSMTQRRSLPFGGPRGEQPTSWPGTKGFVGGVDDTADTGFVHLGARQYDSGIGRFLSVDPVMDLSDPQQIHGYTYSNNNPVTWSDPTGLAFEECVNGMYVCKGGTKPIKKGKNYDKIAHKESTPSKGAVKGTAQASAVVGVRGYGVLSRPAPARPRCTYTGNACNSMIDSVQPKTVKETLYIVRDLAVEWATPDYESWETCFGKGDVESCVYVGLDVAKPVKGAGMFGKKLAKQYRKQCNSFLPGTQVLMADGSSKAIEDVKVGDEVLAADPETGELQAQLVTAELFHAGDKQLVSLTIDIDGQHGDLTAEVVATDGHPFWVPGLDEWIDAADLRAGQNLLARDGSVLQVVGVRHWMQDAAVFNLTVANMHTYYVLAGQTPVLVHNSNCDLPEGYTSSPALKGDPYHPDSVAGRSAQNRELYAGSVGDRAGGLGYRTRIPAQKAPFDSHGQVVFSNGKNYITPDVDGHNVTGGWKMFNRRGQRIGTYDPDLNYLKE
ncbi:polymorphic toxin-type HINT domain-containing protein [Streptomyces sp. 549]|uniref:polymorphic toxin-type HINT domain-containing protein n=1 Tax=Streptomyces sp. 549 TaxID=3049076 RepID=UPI0024C3B41F|nr:polymorphic toxin-type HINT domain-containing protein [Streptomyces sp. 549]MDK1472402.1 polymorphic toxin-type HINT domain-containing protein [Streptomyces sp. 549]